MNKIVREHYPVEKLPDDLREAFSLEETVTVVLRSEREADSGPLTKLAGRFGNRRLTSDAAVARIRALRDEWDT